MWRLPVDDDPAEARGTLGISAGDLWREQAEAGGAAPTARHSHHPRRSARSRGVFGGIRGPRDYEGPLGAVLRVIMRTLDVVVG
jgi:hypothetical protein